MCRGCLGQHNACMAPSGSLDFRERSAPCGHDRHHSLDGRRRDDQDEGDRGRSGTIIIIIHTLRLSPARIVNNQLTWLISKKMKQTKAT
jgi:hypothetical protein